MSDGKDRIDKKINITMAKQNRRDVCLSMYNVQIGCTIIFFIVTAF